MQWNDWRSDVRRSRKRVRCQSSPACERGPSFAVWRIGACGGGHFRSQPSRGLHQPRAHTPRPCVHLLPVAADLPQSAERQPAEGARHGALAKSRELLFFKHTQQKRRSPATSSRPPNPASDPATQKALHSSQPPQVQTSPAAIGGTSSDSEFPNPSSTAQ